MSAVAPRVVRFTRALSCTAAASHPSHLLRNGTRIAASTRQAAKEEARSEDADASNTRPITTTTAPSTRPTIAVPRQPKVPLMQGFTTSAPVCTTTTTTAPSRVDACVLPSLADAPYDPYAHVRVPLLPSVRAASVAGRAAEEPQRPFVPAEMVVVAADPANVAHAALTEVEGFSVDGVELGFAHGMDLAPGTRMEQGMIRDIWKGLVDDVFGPGAGAGASTGMGADAGAAGAKPSTAL